jgi:hypothetical protein
MLIPLEMTEIGSLCSKQVCRILIIRAYCGKSTLTSYVHMMHGEVQLGAAHSSYHKAFSFLVTIILFFSLV